MPQGYDLNKLKSGDNYRRCGGVETGAVWTLEFERLSSHSSGDTQTAVGYIRLAFKAEARATQEVGYK